MVDMFSFFYRHLKQKNCFSFSMSILLLFVSVCFAATAKQSFAQTVAHQSNGVVLIYHRFGEGDYPSTNTSFEQLDAHIAELSIAGKYQNISLTQMIADLESGAGYNKPTVSITVDDAYKSVFSHAWPKLKAAGIPLTVFVATDTINDNSTHYMSWEQIRDLAADGVTIAHHGASHKHYLTMGDDEIIADIERANAKFQQELGFVPDVFAYPYGEYNERIIKLIKTAGIKTAFTQLSGPIANGADVYTLPRFPINERYGGIDRFKLITGTLPLDLDNVMPSDPFLTSENNPPVFGFSLNSNYPNLSNLACYPSHLGKAAELNIIGNKRVEVRFDKAFPEGRNRINCTMPAGDGRWFWFGKLFIVK